MRNRRIITAASLVILAGGALAATCILEGQDESLPLPLCPAQLTEAPVDDGVWTLGVNLRQPRSEIKAAALDGRIYLVGGLLAGDRPSPTVEAYDVAASAWLDLAPLPVALHHMGVAAANGRLYVTDGYDAADWVADVKSGWAYEPETDSWSQIADMPSPRTAHGTVTIDDLIYVIGGDAPEDTTGLWVYDPQTDRWDTTRTSLPTPREHVAATVLDGKIYVVGGRWPVFQGNLSVVEVYDPATDSWSRWADLPTPRHGMGSVVLDGRWYVMAGATGAGGKVQHTLSDLMDIFTLTEQATYLGGSR